MKSLATITTLLGAMVYLVASENMEQKLLEKFGADTPVLPVSDSNGKVNVTFGITITEAFPEKEFKHSALMRFKTWQQLSWKDSRLQWNPAEYGGLAQIHIPITAIWRPDIKLFNSATASEEQDLSSLAIASSDGTVLWVPQSIAVMSCPWKRDVIKCQAKYGSWTYNGNLMNLEFSGKAKADLSYFTGLEYDVARNKAVRHVRHYDCCPEPYIDLTYDLYLKVKK